MEVNPALKSEKGTQIKESLIIRSSLVDMFVEMRVTEGRIKETI